MKDLFQFYVFLGISRKISCVLTQIIDPIGIVSPVTLVPKILLHESWQLTLWWYMPYEIKKLFKMWLKEIYLIVFCNNHRSVFEYFEVSYDSNDSIINIFCDSSSNAFATCTFLKTKISDNVSIPLLQTKSRLPPKNVRLCQWVKKPHQCYWKWIKTKHNWYTFVGNRKWFASGPWQIVNFIRVKMIRRTFMVEE